MLRAKEEMKGRRHDRVVELMRREVDEILRREVKDPRVHGFTVTGLELSPDLRSSRVLVSRFMSGEELREPTETEREELLEGLNSAAHFVYERLKKRLVMKQIPRVNFEYDLRWQAASRIWELTRADVLGLAPGVSVEEGESR